MSGALIIQPGNHKFDHSYVTSVLKAHPDKFVGMLLANPTEVCPQPLNTNTSVRLSGGTCWWGLKVILMARIGGTLAVCPGF